MKYNTYINVCPDCLAKVVLGEIRLQNRSFPVTPGQTQPCDPEAGRPCQLCGTLSIASVNIPDQNEDTTKMTQEQRIEKIVGRVVAQKLRTTRNREHNYLIVGEKDDLTEVELCDLSGKPDGLVRTKAQWADAYWVLTSMCVEAITELLKEET